MSLHVDFDRDAWLYVPGAWPWEAFASLEEWRDAVTASIAEAYEYAPPMRGWLSDVVEGIGRSVGDDEHRFAYLGRPHEAVAIASVYEWPRVDATVEEMLAVDDPSAVRPPVVVPFDGGRLGPGMKSVRHAADPSDAAAISAVAQWAWRLPDRDVLMIVGDDDLARFAALQEECDALARSIGTAPDEGTLP